MKRAQERLKVKSEQEHRLEDSKVSLEIELKRWQAKYNDMKKEHDEYKAKVED